MGPVLIMKRQSQSGPGSVMNNAYSGPIAITTITCTDSVNVVNKLETRRSRLHNYYISDLIDRRIDFDQWEFCVVWATRISFLDVLSAVL
jgi:hypothetical protein